METPIIVLAQSVGDILGTTGTHRMCFPMALRPLGKGSTPTQFVSNRRQLNIIFPMVQADAVFGVVVAYPRQLLSRAEIFLNRARYVLGQQ